MFRSRFNIFRLLVISAALLVDPRVFYGCGPTLAGIIFTNTLHPDFPLDRFARGELGILQPTYARSYLLIAYRHLKGIGLDSNEAPELVALWRERMLIDSDSTQAPAGSEGWLEERKKIVQAGDAPKIDPIKAFRGDGHYSDYLNCHTDAFETAAKTLRDRAKQFGAASPTLIAWVQAQDQVFSNCSGGKNIPPPAAADAPPLARADRAYQIAAANFYEGSFDEARRLFGEIAADAASPWRQVAPLLAARSLIRAADLGQKDAAALTQAGTELKRILNDRGLKSTHESAQRLLGLVEYRLNPEKRVRELAQAVQRKGAGAAIKQDVVDYTRLLDRYQDQDNDRKVTVPASARQDDLTDWIFTFQAQDKAGLEHSLQRWAETSSSWWMIAALSKIKAQHPKAPALLEAAAAVPPDSPAFATAAYHNVRLMLEAGRQDEVRQKLDQLLAVKTPLPASARNQLLELRMKLARDAAEFFTFAQRAPAGVSYNFDAQEVPIESTEKDLDASLKPFVEGRVSFAEDSARSINEALPLGVLKDAALGNALPAHLRRQLAVAAWTRAVLLDDDDAARALAPALLALLPEMKTLLDPYLAAGTAVERKDAGLYLILKVPGMRPLIDVGVARLTPHMDFDSLRDNWWCDCQGRSTDSSSPQASPEPLGFLNATQQSTVAAERRKLNALGIGPNDLCVRAVEWANRNPADPRVPEALHLAVKATHYGCRDKQTRRYSKQAFDALHKQYPDSAWAKRTKYFYGLE